MPSKNGITSTCPTSDVRKQRELRELRDRESVIRWNLTCKSDSSKGTGVAE